MQNAQNILPRARQGRLVRVAAALAAALAVAAFCLLRPAPASAQTLSLSNLVLDNQAGSVTLRFSLLVDEVERLEAMLLDGATLVLHCRAELERHRGMWTDQTLSEAGCRSTLRADTLTQEFEVQAPGDGQALRGQDLEQLLTRAWEQIALDLGSFANLKRGSDYSVSLTVSLEHADVPPWLKSSLFFWSWEVAPQIGYSMDFQY
jgi:hypothetical protein